MDGFMSYQQDDIAIARLVDEANARAYRAWREHDVEHRAEQMAAHASFVLDTVYAALNTPRREDR
jgi:hypothetical protein